MLTSGNYEIRAVRGNKTVTMRVTGVGRIIRDY
jgi:hypothetical protein